MPSSAREAGPILAATLNEAHPVVIPAPMMRNWRGGAGAEQPPSYLGPQESAPEACGRFPEKRVPARSTIGDWLRKKGLSQRRPAAPTLSADFCRSRQSCALRHLVCAGFRGWFAVGDKEHGYLLTRAMR